MQPTLASLRVAAPVGASTLILTWLTVPVVARAADDIILTPQRVGQALNFDLYCLSHDQ